MTTEEKRIDEEKSSQLDRPEPIPGFPEFGHIPFEGLHNTCLLYTSPSPRD